MAVDGGSWLNWLSTRIGRALGIPAEDHPKINVCVLGAMGSTLEWFDFAAFGYFSDVFSVLFFPDSDAALSLMKTFVVFWIAFLFRPIGGVFFGWIGDRYGRKPAVLSAIVTMALSTASMGYVGRALVVRWQAVLTPTASQMLTDVRPSRCGSTHPAGGVPLLAGAIGWRPVGGNLHVLDRGGSAKAALPLWWHC